MTQSLTSKTLHGLKWSYTATIINSVLQIGYSAVMARLLEPAAFGLIAMAGVVLRFGQYFAQMGVGSALIQKNELTENEIKAGFTSSLLLGAFFTLLTWFAAPLALYIFKSNEVIPIVRILGFSFLLGGLSITSVSLLRRKMNFKATAIGEIISYIFGYAGVGLIMAWQGFGVWSMVGAALSQKIVSALIFYLFERHSLKLVFKWEYYQPLYAFGGRVSIIGFLEFIYGSMPTFFVGRWLGAELLGIFNRAYYIVNLPMQYFTGSLSRVLFPSLSQIQAEIPRLKKTYLTATQLLALILIPVCIAISISAKEIVLILLGDKWLQAIPVLQVLALITPLDLLTHLDGLVCEATAKLNVKIMIMSLQIGLLSSLIWFWRDSGVIGAAYAIFISEFFRYIFYKIILKSILKIRFKEYLSTTGSFALVAVFFYILFSLLVYLARILNPALFLMLGIEVVGAVFLFFALIYFYPHSELKRELRKKFLYPIFAKLKMKNNVRHSSNFINKVIAILEN